MNLLSEGEQFYGYSVQSRLQKVSSEKGCTVAITGALEEVVELGWLHAKMHHAHKDEEEKGSKTGSAAMPKEQTISLISKDARRINDHLRTRGA